ncbi:hypothetical protein HOY80DRAFT_358577 [Tuber brumale]|nr:hypothetical protein HOY80DRAFT_358577 [Tuber brumale]
MFFLFLFYLSLSLARATPLGLWRSRFMVPGVSYYVVRCGGAVVRWCVCGANLGMHKSKVKWVCGFVPVCLPCPLPP